MMQRCTQVHRIRRIVCRQVARLQDQSDRILDTVLHTLESKVRDLIARAARQIATRAFGFAILEMRSQNEEKKHAEPITM